MRAGIASWLRRVADRLDPADDPARNDQAMFLRAERPELRPPVHEAVGVLDIPAFVEPHGFDEYHYWPVLRSGGGMYL